MNKPRQYDKNNKLPNSFCRFSKRHWCYRWTHIPNSKDPLDQMKETKLIEKKFHSINRQLFNIVANTSTKPNNFQKVIKFNDFPYFLVRWSVTPMGLQLKPNTLLPVLSWKALFTCAFTLSVIIYQAPSCFCSGGCITFFGKYTTYTQKYSTNV